MTILKTRTTFFVFSMFQRVENIFVATFSADDFIQTVGIEPCNEKEVVKLIYETFRGLVIYRKMGTLHINWFSSIVSRPDGQIEISLSNSMQEFLCETEKLLPMTDIISILKLSNLNSVKLYAIARRFEKIGEFIFTIDGIKKFLGVGTDEYMSYARFKIDIFEPSIKEIYESTGLIIIYDEVVDTNSNVLELRFSISRKNTVSIAN